MEPHGPGAKHITTGDYYLFFINVNTDGGSGPLDYIRKAASGSWNATINPLDVSINNQALSIRPTGTSPTLDLVYAQGTSTPVTIKFARLSPPNPANFSLSANLSNLTFNA